MVTCAICQKSLHYISNTHLAIHAVSQQEYLDKYGGPLKGIEYMEKAYSKERRIKLGRKMSLLRKTGVIISPPPSEEQKKLISLRMLEHNPMKDPEVARKVGEKLRGRKGYERTIKQRLLQRDLKLGEKNPRFKYGSRKNYRLILWTKTRREVLERDGKKCTVNGCAISDEEHRRIYGKGLHVDHKKRWLVSRDNSSENLITLCRKHHIEAERKHKEEEKRLKAGGKFYGDEHKKQAILLGQDSTGTHFIVTLKD